MKKMISLITFVLFLSGIFLICNAQNKNELHAKLDEYMIRVTKNGFSGALLVAKDDKIIVSKGYGLANRERNIPVTDQTVFTIGSITKQFTGAAILKLQMMEKLSVNESITKYFENVPEGAGADSYYGYGWAIFTTPRNTRLIAHNGGNMTFAADFLRYVDEKVVIIIMSNTAGKSAIRVSPDISRIVFGYEYKLPPEKIEGLSKDDLKNSEMWRRVLALLEIYKTIDEQRTLAFIKENFEPEYLKRATEEKLFQFIQQDQKGIGEAKIGQIVRTCEYSIELTVQSQQTGEWWLITLEFEEQAPHRISKIGVVDTVPPVSSNIGEESDVLNAKWGLPNSNTGRRSAALLEAIDRMDESYARQFIESNFTPDFLNEFSIEEHLSQFKKMHEDIGKLELLGAIKMSPNSARLKVRSTKTGKIFKIELELEPEEPYQFVGITVKIEEK